MPATFVSLNQGDVFKSGGSADHLVKIDSVDNIIGKDGLAVYDNVSAMISETIQYFLTFDDVIKYIHFGKGIGAVTAEGTLYSDCTGNIPGLAKVASAISGLRGKKSKAVIGNMPLDVIFTQATISVVSEPDTMGRFSFQLAVINHQM